VLDALVVHYHELGLKGRNRDFFERALAQNLKRALRGTGYSKLRRGFGRIVVDFEPDARVELGARRAAQVFGVAYVGAGRRVEPELDAIGDVALELMLAEPFESFRVRSRRTHSTCTHKSSEIQEIVGARIKDATGGRVDLRNADATAWVELFAGAGIVYRKRLRGPGGLPVGTSGRVLALLSGGIDSPVAAWRMALRGATVDLVHFHGQPFTDPSSARQAADLAQVLARYQMRAVLRLVPLGDVQREIVTNSPSSLRVILYRRMMMRIAARLAEDLDAQALVTGDSLGQVASQTFENIRTVDAAVPGVQVLRPLVGMDKQEIVDLATMIGTYEISTRKHQDCCVLFEPRSPATKTRADQATAAEAGLDVETLIGKALSGIETQVFELEA
jgi:thiamine biosynthesis protein ThiI